MGASGSNGVENGPRIDKLDYKPTPDERRLLLRSPNGNAANGSSEPSPGPGSRNTSCSGSFFEHVAEGIQERDRAKMKKQTLRFGGFIWAVIAW